MKRIVTALLAGLLAANAYAAITVGPGAGVKGSVHDMNALDGVVAGITADAQGRVCAFCHTPHHAIDPAAANASGNFDYLPLWSHNLTTNNAFTPYNTVTYQGQNFTGLAVDPLFGPSRLCMSCHDGTVAPDQHYGNVGGTKFNTAGDAITGAGGDDYFGKISVGLNGNFSNDHPIGFILADTVDADNATYGANPEKGFKFTGAEITAGTAMYPANTNGFQVPIKNVLHADATGQLYMTCATCHDVHNKDNATNTKLANTNYLVYADQNGSTLCLTCHNK